MNLYAEITEHLELQGHQGAKASQLSRLFPLLKHGTANQLHPGPGLGGNQIRLALHQPKVVLANCKQTNMTVFPKQRHRDNGYF